MKYLFLKTVLMWSFSTFSQSDLEGTWDTGEQNTQIEIAEVNGKFLGKLKSSNHEKAVIGRIILKDLNLNGSQWTGQIWAAKRQKWFDVEITPEENILALEIDAGIRKKSVIWRRHK